MVTAIEFNMEIAKIYKDFFPQDNVIITDAHQYLLEYYEEFDFIWSSPPCPTHSRIRQFSAVASGNSKAVFPNMQLYEEIIFLMHNFKGKWVVENVKSYYPPLWLPKIIDRHYFWSNFQISDFESKIRNFKIGGYNKKMNNLRKETVEKLELYHGIKLPVSTKNKRLLLRNAIHPEIGKHILDCIDLNHKYPEVGITSV